jgi:hypothetical protein
MAHDFADVRFQVGRQPEAFEGRSGVIGKRVLHKLIRSEEYFILGCKNAASAKRADDQRAE